MSPSYERRVQETAAVRLAYLLRKAGVLSDFQLADFLYPSEDAIQEAEDEQL